MGWTADHAAKGKHNFRPGRTHPVKLQEIILTKRVDRATPGIFASCVTGKVIPEATIAVTAVDNVAIEYLILLLKDVRVRSISTVGSADERLSEKVTLGAKEIHVVYIEQDPDGGPGDVFEAIVH